jgi:hypothetical protein
VDKSSFKTNVGKREKEKCEREREREREGKPGRQKDGE